MYKHFRGNKYNLLYMNCLTKKKKLITLLNQTETKEGEFITENHILIYVVKGKVTFSYGYTNSKKEGAEILLFLPLATHVNYRIEKDARLLLFQLDDNLQICECFGYEEFETEIHQVNSGRNKRSSSAILKPNGIITTYMEGLAYNMKRGINEKAYFEIKIKELLFLLRAFYAREELAAFFSTALYTSTAFPAHILRCHHAYDSVEDLAKAMNYTVSGFSKRFRKSFGTSPSKWMREQKAKRIYREVCIGKLNFKEIADRYNFASTSTFNDFFKLAFGETPGVIRKKAVNGKM